MNVIFNNLQALLSSLTSVLKSLCYIFFWPRSNSPPPSPVCLQPSSVWSPCASLQWFGFYRYPLRCDRGQRSCGNHGGHGVGEASVARTAPRLRRVPGRGQGCRQEGRHRHSRGQSSGESIDIGHQQVHVRQVEIRRDSSHVLSLPKCWRTCHTFAQEPKS